MDEQSLQVLVWHMLGEHEIVTPNAGFIIDIVLVKLLVIYYEYYKGASIPLVLP